MDGIINSVIKLSRSNNIRQAICSYQMDDFLNSLMIMDIKNYNFGVNRVRIG